MKLLSADYVLPISAPPIERGAVAIDESRIVRLGTLDEMVARFPSAEIEDFGPAAILPGLVNCHSHLEITSLRGALDDVENDFTAWLLRLNGIREKLTDDEINAAALNGAVEGVRSGVTCFGDIGRYGVAGFEALKSTGLRGVLFQETEFSAENDTAEPDFGRLIEKFQSLRTGETDLVKVGLSPHSPYTVSPRLFGMIADFAVRNNVKLAIHAAESSDESDLLLNGTGIFTDVYKKYGVEWDSPHRTSVEYLDSLGVLLAKPLLVHCVTVSESDLSLIASSGSTIAHCPKSNAKFGHGYAPLEAIRDAGIAVGLGSDSVASNNVCDILEESRFAALVARNRSGSKRFLTAMEMLETATLGGARALRLDHLIGTLEPGKQADIVIISLDRTAQLPVNDVHTALVFASGASDVMLTIVAGKEVYRSSR